MSGCSGCGSTPAQAPAQPAAPGPSPSTILHRRTQKWVHTHQALIDSIPDGGWKFQTSINGVPLEIVGASAADVMAKTRNYFSANRVPFNETAFWIDANIQWVGRTNVKHHFVSVADLMAMKAGAPGQPPAANSAAHPPSEWGAIAWRFLGLVLAKDRFDASEFIAVMRLVVDMLNPSSNPRLGCSECHSKAAMMLNELIHSPPSDIAAARAWLVTKHNEVNARLGKPQLGISEAAQANFWN